MIIHNSAFKTVIEHPCARTHTYAHPYSCRHTHTHKHMHTHVHAHTHLHTHMHADTQTHTHTNTNTHTHKHMHTHTHTNTCTHTHTMVSQFHANPGYCQQLLHPWHPPKLCLSQSGCIILVITILFTILIPHVWSESLPL